MKKYFFIILLLFLGNKSYAHHISGGEIYYTYLGKSTTDTSKLLYKITLVLYKDTTIVGTGIASLQGNYNISIYRGDNQQLLFNTVVTLKNYDYMLMKTYSPCIINKPPVAFAVATLDTTIEVPNLDDGIYISNSQCCRVDEIINIQSFEIGATFWVKIPGINENKFAPLNSSAIFNRKDTILICKNFPLNLDFSATDSDGDSLVYSFANGYVGAAPPPLQLPATSDPPPYVTVQYIAPYSFTQPLGIGVTINPTTGFVVGNAPDSAGVYLIAVWVEEYRNGFKIAQHKKEFQIRIDNCDYTAADLKPNYITCDPRDSLKFSFKNELIIDTATTQYHWDFGEVNLTTDTSSKPFPTYTYSDTGVFMMKLTVLNNLGCISSDSAIVKIFPGYTANFTSVGYCYQNPFTFTNTTYAKYGFTDSVHWDFGEPSLTTDTSTLAISSYQYLTPGNRMVHLYAHSNKGCIDTVSHLITVLDKPVINLPFRDTLICSIDTLKLLSSSTNNATYLWNPNKWIINNQIQNPLVFPKQNITYFLTVTDHNCVSNDSIHVNVLDFISVDAGPNTNICLGDSFKIPTQSAALSYKWTPALTLDDSTKKSPTAFPTKRVTTYYVKANLGKCQDKDSITIFTSPYPKITLSSDTSICLGDTVRLFGSNFNGDVFNWSPTVFLSDSNSLSPLIKPTISTTYILTSQYLTGCLKPKKDTIKINVVQPFTVFAGRDTSVVFVQPLQLSALVDDASDKQFTWTRFPIKSPNYLNDTTSQYPIATLPQKIDSVYYIIKAFTKENCYAFDTVRILVYKVPPEIFVPTAFTPNEDGKNDIIKPIPVGIKYLNYFNVYNRWGHLLFTTNEMGRGWDGKVNGIYQNSAAFIFTVQGVDYLGNSIYKKGTFVLIR